MLLGGLNMGEYAYDFTGENVHDGASLNPHDPTRMSGGSSGGSGTAVAAGMVAALARLRHQRLDPRAGLLLRPLRPEADLRPPVARRRLSVLRQPRSSRPARPLGASTSRSLFDALQGDDPRDPAQAKRAADRRPPRSSSKGIDGLRIAVAGGYFRERGMPEAFAAVDKVAAALGVDREVTLPEAARARAPPMSSPRPKSSAFHLDRLRTRAADFDPDVRDRLLSGAMVPAAWVIEAQRFRAWFREAMREVFADVDVILAPATPFHALPSGTKTITLGGVDDAGAAEHRHLHPADQLHRPAGRGGAGLARRRARCRSACRSSRRPGARIWRSASPRISKPPASSRAGRGEQEMAA